MEPSLVICQLFNLIDYFLKDTKENFVSAVVVRPRKLKVGLVVPAKFMAVNKELRVPTVLLKEILKGKNYSHYELNWVLMILKL